MIVAHHFEFAGRAASSVAYEVTGSAPNRALEVEWVVVNMLVGTGGSHFRLRFDEGSPIFRITHGWTSNRGSAGTWTQLAMMDTTEEYEEVVLSTGAPGPSDAANTEYTYTPR
jgi:hypothetical protein